MTGWYEVRQEDEIGDHYHMWWVIGISLYFILFAFGLLFLRGASLAESRLSRVQTREADEHSGQGQSAADETGERQPDVVHPAARRAAG